ncbi:MAG TPA: SGNH/GDSL hydrolase family protein [Phycisphaerae bacterium]|nr:SGNH/GDSL hydrolase family protein [Phycisphaerae bacterium]HPS52078.1 SGNH/GDSL hydrolase family protein [Phycisphaerae bacterium]
MTKMNISEIDPNFKSVRIGESDFDFYDVLESPVQITGVFWNKSENCFSRLPDEVLAAAGNELLVYLSRCTAGGQIRFTADSKRIALKFELFDNVDMLHMPRSGSSGFDLFFEGEFIGKAWQSDFAKPQDQCIIADNQPRSQRREYTINMPLYNGVRRLYIGLLPDSRLGGPISGPRKKICFYGSSITQGGCASKPGNAYTSMICRWQNLEQLNMGFSGNAKGEPAIAQYIASQKPDVCVLDYDHNAPTLSHLRTTHEPFFKIIRKALPSMPIIIVSRPNKNDGNEEYGSYRQRRDVIKTTHDNAAAGGDKKVFFVDGSCIMDGPDSSACTMDGIHPNDLGFFRMACVIGEKVKKALEICN